MPACWSRRHSSAKILSMKRSSRVSFVSQCTTSLSECAAAGSMVCGAFISCSRAVTWIDGTGYVVSPLDAVNGVRRGLQRSVAAPWTATPRLGSPFDLRKSEGQVGRVMLNDTREVGADHLK